MEIEKNIDGIKYFIPSRDKVIGIITMNDRDIKLVLKTIPTIPRLPKSESLLNHFNKK